MVCQRGLLHAMFPSQVTFFSEHRCCIISSKKKKRWQAFGSFQAAWLYDRSIKFCLRKKNEQYMRVFSLPLVLAERGMRAAMHPFLLLSVPARRWPCIDSSREFSDVYNFAVNCVNAKVKLSRFAANCHTFCFVIVSVEQELRLFSVTILSP